MGHAYKAVQWTPYKKTFDVVAIAAIATFIGMFIAIALMTPSSGGAASPIQIVFRALGAAAFALLSIILTIGPLARFSPRFLPLLYNRRHLGVLCFVLALIHAALVIVWYHGFSDINPLASLLAGNPRYLSVIGFPFEVLGLTGLFILFVMAATSHDFWNALLGPTLWKTLHMGAYVAYALIVAHIVLGAVAADRGWMYAAFVAATALSVCALHVAAGVRETRSAAMQAANDAQGWLLVGPAADIPDARAKIITPPRGEQIAVFRDGARVFAISNRCRHQGGPLGEGRVVDGCVTCPWHGFQYKADGVSPAPYTERVATYRTKIEGGIVYVHADPQALGEGAEPSVCAP